MPSLSDITQAARAALAAAGVPDSHAEIQLDLLLEAELRGTASHGLLRLPRVIERIASGATDPRAKGQITWRGTALAEVDGGQGLGPVVASHALAAVSARARETGIAAAAIRNCDHLGALAFYAERIARQGQVLVALTVSEALVHPWGGRHAMIGTNPIAIGVPAEPEPFVVDLATSLVAMGKIHDHANRGAPIPEGWALDAAGNPTTDAAAARDGAIAPFGGAKGYALGLGFELLVGAMTAAALGTEVRGTLDSTIPCNKGDLFIVMEPAAGMAATVTRYLDAIRASAPADPAHPVRIPGDRARGTAASRLGLGDDTEIALPPEIWERIRTLAAAPVQN